MKDKIIKFMADNYICSEDAAITIVNEMDESGLISDNTDPAKIAFSWLSMTKAAQGVSQSFWNASHKAFEFK